MTTDRTDAPYRAQMEDGCGDQHTFTGACELARPAPSEGATTNVEPDGIVGDGAK